MNQIMTMPNKILYCCDPMSIVDKHTIASYGTNYYIVVDHKET